MATIKPNKSNAKPTPVPAPVKESVTHVQEHDDLHNGMPVHVKKIKKKENIISQASTKPTSMKGSGPSSSQDQQRQIREICS
jgi:4-diphosphocytidyl-2C-methyl-D-erythritol kinase